MVWRSAWGWRSSGGDAGARAVAFDELGERVAGDGPPGAGVAAIAAAASERDEQPVGGMGGAEGAGALSLPVDDRARGGGRELHFALAVAFSEADVQDADGGAVAGGEEVAALEEGELVAAQAGVAEAPQDREVAQADEAVALDGGGGRVEQAGVELVGERFGRLGSWEPAPDFGLAKLLDSLRFGLTVREFHSRPYSPPERDGGELDARSDLYSLGVTALRLLLPDSRALDDDNLETAIESCTAPEDGRHFLRALTARDPRDRPLTARLALVELDRLLVWEPEPEQGPRPRLKLAITQTALTQARGVLGQDEASVRRLLQQDLSADDLALVRDRRSPPGWTQESRVALDLIGSELLHTARFDREATGTLVVTGVRALPPATLERRRDAGLPVGHDVVFNGEWPSQREDADLLVQQLSAQESERAETAVERSDAGLFERWSEVLEAKSELEARREDPLPYDGVRVEPGMVTFAMKSEVDERYLDQTRRVPVAGGGAVVGTVAEVGEREIGLVVERGSAATLPQTGRLLSDRGPSKRAIKSQQQALEDVRAGDVARADLRELLLRPEQAGELVQAPLSGFLQDLDEPKQHAVQVALYSPDFTLVQGPPGTGKTTLIAELIAQLLAGRPGSRVLLSAQTHVAVDNAAVRLAELRPDLRIVRVGRVEKVEPAAQNLTMPEQLQRWHAEAEEHARGFLASWGQQRGISAPAIEAYAIAAELAAAEDSAGKVAERLRELAGEEERLLDLLTDPHRPAPSATSTGGLVPDEEDELAAVQDDAEARQSELAELSQSRDALTARLAEVLGGPVAQDDDREALLRERSPVDPEQLESFRALAALQDEWLLRFGQGEDFEKALLDSAQVVAGTCVGLAGVLDDEDTFDLAVVDEASKATPTEALVPMARSRRWVLVGDERQLPPFLDSALVDEGLLEGHGLTKQDLRETVFGHLARALPADRRLVLSMQHRMLKPIGDLISHCFYAGALSSSRPERSDCRCLNEVFPAPVTWLSTSKLPGRREKGVGTTYWNAAEVRLVREHLTALQRRAAVHDERLKVAVISGYGEQARRLRRDLRPQEGQWTHLQIDVHPVDSFQGQERDVIIYSVTRSNRDNQLGFLRAEERINVALSRGRDALVIVGDARFCRRAREGRNPFAVVLEYIDTADGCALVEPSR